MAPGESAKGVERRSTCRYVSNVQWW